MHHAHQERPHQPGPGGHRDPVHLRRGRSRRPPSARSMTDPSVCTCARLASSGTTPPKIRCTSCESIDEPGELAAPRHLGAARRPRSRRTRSRCRGSTQPSVPRRTSATLSGTATASSPGRRHHPEPRAAGTGRSGPIHDHQDAVAIERAEPPRGAPDEHFHRRAVGPDDGRQLAGQPERHRAQRPLADVLDLDPDGHGGGHRANAAEPGRVQRQRLFDGTVGAAHLERLGARGVDLLNRVARAQQPNRARDDGDGPEHVTRAGLAAGRRPARAPRAGRWSRVRRQRIAAGRPGRGDRRPAAARHRPGPSSISTSSAAVLSGRRG